jgi:hypothetical protein
MGGTGERQRTFVIRRVVEERADAVLAFHSQFLTEHLWPRTLEEFEDLARGESLLEALETTDGREELVGLCYVMHGQEPEPPGAPRDEFGGMFVVGKCRTLGVGTVLGMVAISKHFAWDPPQGRLIAHVHEANPLPRTVLQEQLGFVKVGQEIPPVDPPPSVARNKDGKVVGHLFEFQRRKLVEFADWLESFAGTMAGKEGVSFEIDLPLVGEYRAQAVEALRSLGTHGGHVTISTPIDEQTGP